MVSSLISNVTQLVQALVGYTDSSNVVHTGWITSFCNAIAANDLLLFFVGLSLVGMAVGFITRLIHARG